jgi:DNA-binding PadR family transcriptional regulator
VPLQHAVLALLAEGPSYGWDLRASFDRAVGPQWGLNVGHLYQVLDRLRREGLATTQVQSQSLRPDRTVFQITTAGRAELDSWLSSPVNRTRGYRDDFFLKLMAAARRDPDTLARVIHLQRQRYLQELRSLAELRATAPADAITAMLVDAATLHTEADLRVVDLAEESARRLLHEVAVSETRPEASNEPETRAV